MKYSEWLDSQLSLKFKDRKKGEDKSLMKPI